MHEYDYTIKVKEMNKKEEKRKGKLAEEMSALTTEIKNSQEEGRRIEAEAKTRKAKKDGLESAKTRIVNLLSKIKVAAKKGESSVYEWCFSGSEWGGYMLGAISHWAKEQGFEVEWSRNCEGANEGQDRTDSITISWG